MILIVFIELIIKDNESMSFPWYFGGHFGVILEVILGLNWLSLKIGKKIIRKKYFLKCIKIFIK